MDTIKLIISIVNPIIILIFGIILLRRNESVKNQVSIQFDFSAKWANEFFINCQEYMKAIEKHITLLVFLGDMKEKNSDIGTKIQYAINELNKDILELNLRVKRLAVFAYKSKDDIFKRADLLQKSISELINSRQGNLDTIILKLDEFNKVIKNGHAEMLKNVKNI